MAYNTTYSTYVSHQSSEQMNVMYFKVLTIIFGNDLPVYTNNLVKY